MKKSHLTLEQRYQIQAWLAVDTKQKEIANLIGKDKSVISREIQRNKRHRGRYTAQYAQERSVRFGKNALNGLESSQIR